MRSSSAKSAIQAGPRVPQDIFPINRDHSGIVKLVNSDVSYLDIIQFSHEAAAKRTDGLWPLNPAAAHVGLLKFVEGFFSPGQRTSTPPLSMIYFLLQWRN